MRPSLPTVAHHVRRGDRDVEVVEAGLDLGREVGRTDDVGAGVLGLLRLLALGEDGDALLAAGSVREHQRAPQLLVGVADVEPEPEMHLDRLVELLPGKVLEQPDRLDGLVGQLAVDAGACLAVDLAVLRHYRSPPPQIWVAGRETPASQGRRERS